MKGNPLPFAVAIGEAAARAGTSAVTDGAEMPAAAGAATALGAGACPMVAVPVTVTAVAGTCSFVARC